MIWGGRYRVELAVNDADMTRGKSARKPSVTISTSSSSTGGLHGRGVPGAAPGTGGAARRGDGSGEDGTGRIVGQIRPGAHTGAATATGTVTEVGGWPTPAPGSRPSPSTVSFHRRPDQFWVGATATADVNLATVGRHAGPVAGGHHRRRPHGRHGGTDGSVDGATEERTVKTGKTSGGMTEIMTGLDPGEGVVVEVSSFGPSGGSPGGGQLPDGAPPAHAGCGGAPTGDSTTSNVTRLGRRWPVTAHADP